MSTLSAAKHNILLSVKTAIVRVFGDKPVLGSVALQESVKKSLHLLQLVAGDVADHCLEVKRITFFQLIDETSLRVLARQCRRQQLAEVTREPPVETALGPPVEAAPHAVAPTLSQPAHAMNSAKRQRSGPTNSDVQRQLISTIQKMPQNYLLPI